MDEDKERLISAKDLAIETLRDLGDVWTEMGYIDHTFSLLEYIKVIKGQYICMQLVDKERAKRAHSTAPP